jgi:hypothetical protein
MTPANGEGPRIGPCEHEPAPEPANDDDARGLMSCARCRDIFGLVVEQKRAGRTKVVAVHCLNCQATIPVRKGFVTRRPPFFFRLRWHLRHLIAGDAP